MEPTAAETITWPSFDDFWDGYGRKIKRPKCEMKWNKLSQKDKEAIMKHLPVYDEYLKQTKFHKKYPETFLNNRSWEDELLPQLNNEQQHSPLDFYRAFIAQRK
jgi:hypothetical protein